MNQQHGICSPKFQSEVGQDIYKISNLNNSNTLEILIPVSPPNDLFVNNSLEYHRIINKKMKILEEIGSNYDTVFKTEDTLKYLNINLASLVIFFKVVINK